MSQHLSADATTSPFMLDWYYFYENQTIQVKFNVAKNPNTSKATLLKIAETEEDFGIWRALFMNPGCDNEVITRFLTTNKSENTNTGYLSQIVTTKCHILNEYNAQLLYDKGCRHIAMAPRLDITRLKEWKANDAAYREKYLDTLIQEKLQDLMKIWID
jgi:hypothetical protein